MSAVAEVHLSKMRRHLAAARELEICGAIGLADAHGRAAARELERAIAEQERADHPQVAA